MKRSRSRFDFSRRPQPSVFRLAGNNTPKPILLSNDRLMLYTIALIVITLVVCVAIQHFFKN